MLNAEGGLDWLLCSKLLAAKWQYITGCHDCLSQAENGFKTLKRYGENDTPSYSYYRIARHYTRQSIGERMSEIDRGAFRFLLREGNQPFLSSRCYIEADPKIDDRKQWVLHLDQPKHATWVYEIDDLKAWMLHGEPVRQIIYDRKSESSPFRDLDRDTIFQQYLRCILERIPATYQGRRKYALMPSISDDESRTRYKRAVETAIPEVTVLPEPEMVAEYFRLLERSLEVEVGRNNVILVVDTGASTTNMTLILSRRDGKIVEAGTSGAQRDLRLRALRGDSIGNAGHWVDLRLATHLGIKVPDTTLLRKIEQAKIEVSRGKVDCLPVSPSEGEPLDKIDRTMLTSVATELWGELRPVFERLCERLYENQTSSESARRRSEKQLSSLNVKGPSDAYRLIDTVLLAGGTSLLPGFEEKMLATIFPSGHHPKVLKVGDAFPIAAAAGGLAHILHNYKPSRLRDVNEDSNEVFTAPFEATLPYPVLMGIKNGRQRENFITLLEPNDPFVDDGGKRPIEGLPPFIKGAKPKARLLPGDGFVCPGRVFDPILVEQAPGNMELEWDPDRLRARILSQQVNNIGHLWIDVTKPLERNESVSNRYEGRLPPNALAVDGAEDIIFDLGMSKIVAVMADQGWISTDELEQVVRGEEATRVSSLVATQPESAFDLRSEMPFTSQDLKHSDVALTRSVKIDSIDAIQEREKEVSAEETTNTHSNFLVQPTKIVVKTGWENRISTTKFAQALFNLKDELKTHAPQIAFDDIVMALLGLAARPIVLLAGPPGCGKSTLVRFIAQILGKVRGKTFHDIAVQANWTNDDALFGNNGILKDLINNKEADKEAHLVLLDEFNLTRPEYYLSGFFHALESGSGDICPRKKIASCRILGTLNIDESSRVPSPKIIDRCFLLELPQIAWDTKDFPDLHDLGGLTPLPALPEVSLNSAGTDENINQVLQALYTAVQEHGLRQDILPSRRVLSDIKTLLTLHHSLELEKHDLLARDELVDRLLASRILVKLSGAFDQIRPALDQIEKSVDRIKGLPRTKQRINLARQQARLGFVSPWQ